MQISDNLLERVSYDPERGIFTLTMGRYAGRAAGSIGADGYVTIGLGRERARAHRLAWRIVHGAWPTLAIDHINGDKTDNRIANLRQVTAKQNRENQQRARSDSRTGLLGVWPVGGKFAAILVVDGRKRRYGTFATPEEAHAVAIAQKAIAHPAFAGQGAC